MFFSQSFPIEGSKKKLENVFGILFWRKGKSSDKRLRNEINKCKMFYIKKLNPKLLMEQDDAREILHSECLFLNDPHCTLMTCTHTLMTTTCTLMACTCTIMTSTCTVSTCFFVFSTYDQT